ncbi:MAG TPA: hypothetical protein VHZ25_09080 [Acidobacteriaceae bacterium]|nr:hypothetical protein [Acidobacteriaceae bacterium]
MSDQQPLPFRTLVILFNVGVLGAVAIEYFRGAEWQSILLSTAVSLVILNLIVVLVWRLKFKRK